jgi:hypothetical protein
MDYFLIAVISFGLLLIYTLIQSRSTWYLYLIIPIVLASGVGIYITYHEILGYPTIAKSSKKFTLISHTVTEEHIFMWVLHDNETQPRAYEMPYTDEDHAQLAAAAEGQASGAMIQGEFENQEDSLEAFPGVGSNKSEGGEFKLYDIKPQDILPRKQDSPTTTHIIQDSVRRGVSNSSEPIWDFPVSTGP